MAENDHDRPTRMLCFEELVFTEEVFWEDLEEEERAAVVGTHESLTYFEGDKRVFFDFETATEKPFSILSISPTHLSFEDA